MISEERIAKATEITFTARRGQGSKDGLPHIADRVSEGLMSPTRTIRTTETARRRPVELSP